MRSVAKCNPAQINFTLQPQLLLAPVCYEDSWPVIVEKINLVARFIDVLIVSRVTNYRSVDYSTIKNFVFKRAYLETQEAEA